MTTTEKPGSVAETLRAARALIEDPKHWTKGSVAKTANGAEVVPEHPAAIAWCSAGALQRVTDHESTLYEQARWQFAKANHVAFMAELNDRPETTHADVLAAFDKAIDLAEKAEARS